MIRTYQPDDLPRLLEIWLESNLQAHPFVPPRYWRDHLSMVGELLPQALLYLWEEQGRVLGFAGLTGGYLAGIFVDAAARSRGIGSRLLDRAKADHRQLTLRVYRKNRRAVDFYLRNGFALLEEGRDPDTGEEELLLGWGQGEAPQLSAPDAPKGER